MSPKAAYVPVRTPNFRRDYINEYQISLVTAEISASEPVNWVSLYGQANPLAARETGFYSPINSDARNPTGCRSARRIMHRTDDTWPTIVR
jgi:hypothetical protein